MSQFERIFFINRQLEQGRHLTVQDVSNLYEVSVRQVKRDIEYLRDRLNAPIVYNTEKKTYQYEEEFNDLKFADQKLILFYVLSKSLLKNDSYIPLYSEELTEKLQNDVPQDYRPICEKITYQVPYAEKINPDFFYLVCSAMRDKTYIDIVYSDLKNTETARRVEPLHIVNYSSVWYLIAEDLLHNGLRTFHFSRIQKMAAAAQKTPSHTKQYEIDLAKYVDAGFGIFKGGKIQNVTVRFYGYAMKVVESQIWHESQKMTTGIEGARDKKKLNTERRPYREVTFPVADFTEVLSRILSFGANARPMAPQKLRTLWQTEIAAMQAESLR